MSETLSIAAFSLVMAFICGWCGWLTSQKGVIEQKIDDTAGRLYDKYNELKNDQVRLRTQFDMIFDSLGEKLLQLMHRDDDKFGLDKIIDELRKNMDKENESMISEYEKSNDLPLPAWIRLKEKCEAALADKTKPDEQKFFFLLLFLFCVHKINR